MGLNRRPVRTMLVAGLILQPLAVLARHGSNLHQDQRALVLDQDTAMLPAEPKRVAIIGAGAAGSSAAFFLRDFAAEAHIPISISVFERSPYIGGRSTTVNVYGAPDEPVELGASIFVQVNQILVNASRRFELETQDASDRVPPGYKGPTLGIWNGAEFVFTQSANGGWWDTAKLFMRYGLSPLMALRAKDKSIGKFLTMYNPPIFPWEDLGDQIQALGLIEDVSVTGEQLLRSKGVGDLFAQELVQASTRVNYAQNLGAIHGLEALVCLATDGAVSIKGGNWQIFSRLARSSGAKIHLNTTVTRLSREKSGKYLLQATSTPKSSEAAKDLKDEFNEVLIAAPLQFTDLKIDSPLQHAPDEIPYVKLHVTLFASRHKLAPSAFNLPPDEPVPLVVLTTLHPSEKPGSKPTYAGKAGFFSISMLKPIMNPSTGTTEYLYKIFSPEPVSDDFFSKILDIPRPKSGDSYSREDISWLHRKIWHSYPVEYPRVTFEKLQLAPGIWYSSGIESFISTMETSALSGMNIAKLIVNRWSGEATSGNSSFSAAGPDAQGPLMPKAKL